MTQTGQTPSLHQVIISRAYFHLSINDRTYFQFIVTNTVLGDQYTGGVGAEFIRNTTSTDDATRQREKKNTAGTITRFRSKISSKHKGLSAKTK